MNQFNNIFLKIDYEKEIVTVNPDKPFISYIHYWYILHSKDTPYINWNILPNWSFEFLIKTLKIYCSVKQIKNFLKEYPYFIGYII